MLKRKFYDKLLEWKNNHKQTCLLVKGARQIGKTFIIDLFGRENYESYIYINFIEMPQTKDIFSGELTADEIYKLLTLVMPEVKYIEHNTLLFLDEIQECPQARTALKFLAIDGRFDVIASGSLLGISYKEVTSIPRSRSDMRNRSRCTRLISRNFSGLWDTITKKYSDNGGKI